MRTSPSGCAAVCDPLSLVAASYEDDDERAVGLSWLGAATAWTNSVRARVMQPWRSAGQPPDVTMILSENGVWVEQLNTRVRPRILGVLRRAYSALSGNPPPDGFDESQYTTSYLNASVNRMSNIPEEVYRDIARQVAEGIAAGEPIDEIARRVDQELTVSGSQRWANRSVVVARTEVTGAVNAGSLASAGAQQAETGVRMLKTWQATTRPPSSERTRPAHLAADGQSVPLTQAFNVGGERLQYPGDPAGSAGNVIQCRCALTYREA